jgi:hypothetical protein
MVISCEVAGPQNPIYGIHYTNITDRLTQRNWKTKAVVRSNFAGWLYLWIAKRTHTDKAGRKVSAYFVKVHAIEPRERIQYYQAQFKSLTDALRYINGEDDGRLACETTPASPSALYPAEQNPPIYFRFVRRPKIAPRKKLPKPSDVLLPQGPIRRGHLGAEDEIMSERSLQRCPKCGAYAGIPILYGYPSSETLEAAEKGEIKLGGCIVTFDQPNWSCRSCHHRWRYPCLVNAQPTSPGRI